MSKVTVFSEEEINNISPLIMTVQQFLMEKSMFEKKKHDKLNMTSLGGVGFYFEYDDNNTYLMYTKHPKEWNEFYIKKDIEEYNRYMMIQKGAYIQL